MLYLVNKNTTHFNQFKEYIPLCQKKKNISHNNDNNYKQINSTSYQKKKKKFK